MEIKNIENWKGSGRPQDDVPAEKIIQYVVKDYQRLFERSQNYEPRIKRMRQKISDLIHLVKSKHIEAMSESELKNSMKGLIKRASKAESENEAMHEHIIKCHQIIKDLKDGRNAVVEAVTKDIEDRLAESNRKVELLAQAVTDPNIINRMFPQNMQIHTIETDDDKIWMKSAMGQLEKSALGLLTIAARLNEVEASLKNTTIVESKDKTMKALGKALNKITSVVSHIECFMDKVGDIKIIDNDNAE